MKSFVFIVISLQSVCLSQYVFGRGIYLGIDVNYQKEYLDEVKTVNNSVTTESFKGDGRTYGIDLVYALNRRHLFSLEYKRSSMTIFHDSEFFVYSNTTIKRTASDLEFNIFRAQYWFFFRQTNVFVGGGVESSTVDVPKESIFYEKYKQRVTGIMSIGMRIGSPSFMLLPYASYAVPFLNLRRTDQQSISLTELRLGLKLMIHIL